MKVRGLQQQLAASTYLLPSQRELLSRLLFQLAFNDFSKLAIFGAAGSGKSTLALALAELFSECQEMVVNVALLQAPLTAEHLVAQLAKQWFAAAHLSAAELADRLAADAEHTEWVLIVDDPERLNQEQLDWLQNLPVRLFLFAGSAQQEMQLNLAIPAVTLQDCEQLLQAETLSTLSVAERFAHSHGNLHLLVAKSVAVPKAPQAATKPTKPLLAAAVGGALVLLVVLTLWINDTAEQQPQNAGQANTADTANVIKRPVSERIAMNEPERELPDTELQAELNIADHNQEQASPSLEPAAIAPEVAITKVDAEYVEPETPVAAEPSVTAQRSVEAEMNTQAELTAEAAKASGSATAKPQVKPASTQQAALPLAVYDHLTLLNAPANNLVVQLAVLSGENALQRFKQRYPQLQVLIYQRSWQGKEQWIIVSGPFTSSALAKQHIQQLPGSLSAAGPFTKTVGAVQQEILAWQRLQIAKPN